MDNVQAVAIELARIMSMEVSPIPDSVLIDTAEGNMLDRKALDYNMVRTTDETDESFRNRILERIQRPIISGNKNHYVHWAKSVDGVGNAKVESCWNGNGTVKVVILSSNYGVPDDEIIENVAQYIEVERPIGASVTIVKATPVQVSVSATIAYDSNFNIEEIKTSFTESFQNYLNSIAFDENKVLSYYKIGDILFNIEGVTDIIEYTLNGDKVSLQTAFEEFFILNEVVIDGN